MKSNISMIWPLAMLVALGLNVIPLAYGQGCGKECGFGGEPMIAHRSCTGVGATNCHVSLCQEPANDDCTDMFNDICTGFGADDPNDAEAHTCFD